MSSELHHNQLECPPLDSLGNLAFTTKMKEVLGRHDASGYNADGRWVNDCVKIVALAKQQPVAAPVAGTPDGGSAGRRTIGTKTKKREEDEANVDDVLPTQRTKK